MKREPLVRLPSALTAPQPRPHPRHLLGVDGGATKTLAGVLDLRTRELHLARGGPSNSDAVGARAAVRTLLACANEAIERSGLRSEQLDSAVLAVAGTDTESLAAHVHAAHADWIVVNDVVGAWATATGAGPGVAAIAGTGSNVFGVGPGGRSWRAGGWGHVLGDEGSGYWLGVKSIRAALCARDASGPPTALSEAVPAFFGAPSVEALASRVYSRPLTKGEIAAFATRAQEIALAGDAVTRSLYERGARALGRQIDAVIEMTALAGEFPVGLIGSVFRAGDLYVGPLARTVHERAPEASVAIVDLPPVLGSLLLAARACGRAQELPRSELGELISAQL